MECYIGVRTDHARPERRCSWRIVLGLRAYARFSGAGCRHGWGVTAVKGGMSARTVMPREAGEMRNRTAMTRSAG